MARLGLKSAPPAKVARTLSSTLKICVGCAGDGLCETGANWPGAAGAGAESGDLNCRGWWPKIWVCC